MEGNYYFRCCRCCKAPCAGDFKKIAELERSRLAIYIYTKKDEREKEIADKYGYSFILHNAGNQQIARPEFIAELKLLKSECCQCGALVHDVRNLLDEIKDIRESEVVGICEHCRLASLIKTPCERCNNAVRKFLSINQKSREEKQQRYKVWLCKVRRLLQSIIIAGENVLPQRVRDLDLERLLHEFKVPLGTRRPDIGTFPTLDQARVASMSESKELLEELLSKLKYKGDVAHITSDSQLYSSPSKELCLCKFIKQGYYEEKLEGRRRLLSYQEFCNSLIERLLELSKALQQGVPVNKRVVQEILKTLNEVGTNGLTPNIITKLIKQLKDLHSALPHDISKHLSKDGIQDLINDLNDLLIKDRSQSLSDEDLYKRINDKLLTLKKHLPRGDHENKKLNQEIHESLNEIIRKGLTTKVIAKLINQLKDFQSTLPQDISKYISKDGIQELIDDLNDLLVIAASKKVTKDLLQLLVDVSDMINQELSKKIAHDKKAKSIKEGLFSKSQDSLQQPLMIPEVQKKDEEDRTQILPSVQREKEGLPKDGSCCLFKGSSKTRLPSLVKAPYKHSAHTISSGQSEDETQDVLKDQSKDDKRELSKALSKKSMQSLTKALSKQSGQGLTTRQSEIDTQDGLSKKSLQGLTKAHSKQSAHGLPRAQGEVDTQDGLETQSKEGAPDLSRDSSKKSMQGLSTVHSDETKDEERELSKRKSKKSMHGLLKAESRVSTHSLPVLQSHHEMTPEEPKKMEKKMSRQQIKQRLLGLPLSSVKIKDDIHDLSKVTTKDLAQDLQKKGRDKDLHKTSQKELKQDATAHKEGMPKSQTKLTPSLSERSMAKPQIDDIDRKTQKEIEPESSQSSINKSISLLQKLSNLNQALSSKSLDKYIVEELAKDIKEALGEESSDTLQKIVKALTDLCKSAMEGIPTTADIKKVQEIIDEASTALGRGLSEDENKITVQNLLNNLYTTLTEENREKLKIGTSKDPRILKPPSKRDLKEIRALAAKASKLGDITDKDTEKDDNLGKKTDNNLGKSAESAPDDVSPKKGLKSKKSLTATPDDVSSKKGLKSKKSLTAAPDDVSVKKELKPKKSLTAAPDDVSVKKELKPKKSLTAAPDDVSVKKELKPKKSLTAAPDDVSVKKGLKLKKSPTGKAVETEGISEKSRKMSPEDERMKRKTNLELASEKEKIKYKFGDDDDSPENELKIKSRKEEKSKKPSVEDKISRKPKLELASKKGKTKHKLEGDNDSLETSEKELKQKAKKGAKSKKTPEEDISGKTKLELLASKKGKIKYKFETDDDSLEQIYDEKEKKSQKKEEKPKKGKENQPPLESKKTQELKSKPKQKESTIDIKRPKQVSESALRKLLSTNRLNLARYAAYKEKLLAREKEKERRRLRELALKNMPPRKPKRKPKPPVTPEDTISSLLECETNLAKHPSSMIKGETIVPYDHHYKDHKHIETKKEPEPLLFKSEHTFGSEDNSSLQQPEFDPGIDYEAMFRDGIIRYRLSNREFIDNGWTVLPTKKIMRRMNIYKMKPAYPKHDWFELHKHDRELFYDSGERLAYIDTNGRGHWFYRNGTVALDYYNAKESNIGQRYVVYSTGTEIEQCGTLKPRTILALFDVLGNGVVYDHYGNVRLKYNQTEGLLVDSKLGPPGKWKWHSLNDPPVLQQVFLNKKERDSKLEQVTRADRAQEGFEIVKQVDPEMMAIELDNFAKEKSSDLMKKFKPFQIRMKAVKLNDHFSLKILDQSSITLLFRDGATSLKLHLGMHLISTEIVDTDTADISEVSTPYDKHPAKTHSLENIHKILKTVRSGKVRQPLELTVNSYDD